MGNMSVEIAGVKLKNPVMTASGTFGSGAEFMDYIDLSLLGGLTTKGVSDVPWTGNPTPRVAETASGMLNAIGLQNPGIDVFIKRDLEKLRGIDTVVMANVCGHTTEEYVEVVKRLADNEVVKLLEINISCPNVKAGGITFGTNADAAYEVTKAIKKYAKQPVIMKLTPNVTDVTEIARACAAGGADGISMINNFKAMRIDLSTGTTVTAMKYAGLSGPAIRPIAQRMVNEVVHAVKLPIIGIGGIRTADDVLEMIMSGATAIEIGSANLIDPWTMPRIISELQPRMDELGIKSLEEIRGVV